MNGHPVRAIAFGDWTKSTNAQGVEMQSASDSGDPVHRALDVAVHRRQVEGAYNRNTHILQLHLIEKNRCVCVYALTIEFEHGCAVLTRGLDFVCSLSQVLLRESRNVMWVFRFPGLSLSAAARARDFVPAGDTS